MSSVSNSQTVKIILHGNLIFWTFCRSVYLYLPVYIVWGLTNCIVLDYSRHHVNILAIILLRVYNLVEAFVFQIVKCMWCRCVFIHGSTPEGVELLINLGWVIDLLSVYIFLLLVDSRSCKKGSTLQVTKPSGHLQQ